MGPWRPVVVLLPLLLAVHRVVLASCLHHSHEACGGWQEETSERSARDFREISGIRERKPAQD
eukprot:8993574-Pyramimonas_sp.AAC.1